MLITVHGIVVHTMELPARDRLVTIFTRESGLLTAVAMGRHSPRVSFTASSQIFCYGEFVLYSKKDDHFWIREITLDSAFLPLRSSIERVALATYFCDVIAEAATNEPDIPLLRLLLNALYALSGDTYEPRLIKATFEYRVAALLGFMPDVSGCAGCGATTGEFFLNVMEGQCLCRRCHQFATETATVPSPDEDIPGVHTVLLYYPPQAFAALAYCLTCPLEKILSFRLTGEDLIYFCRGGERYLLNHLERSFSSLDFYQNLLK